MFEKILVCLDGSELSEEILPYATEQALHFNSEVVLIEVLSEPVIVDSEGANDTTATVQKRELNEQAKQAELEAFTYLEHFAQPMRKKGLSVQSVVRQGTASSAIVTYAAENGIRLIAMATRGRGGLGRAVYGSVTDFVLRESGLPVLAVRPASAREPEQG